MYDLAPTVTRVFPSLTSRIGTVPYPQLPPTLSTAIPWNVAGVSLMLPHLASMFCHRCHRHSFKFASLPCTSWARYAVLHTFPFNAHLSLIVNTLVSSCLIIRLSLSALLLGIIHDV
jgi:hypothetical protein